MYKKFLLPILFVLFQTLFSPAFASVNTLLPLQSPAIFNSSRVELGSSQAISDESDYQIGSEWGKLPVDLEKLNEATPAFRRAVMATARLGGGTAFYLGEFNGKYVVATNYHVFSDAFRCSFLVADFTAAQVKAKCDTYLGSWTDIDLALFTVTFSSVEDKNKMAEYAGNFAFNDDLVQGQTLITVGHGKANNPRRVLMANQDSDCKVFSQSNEFRFMADPDEFNPGPYKAWSFSNGCEVSHGDSGSAMVDRQSGKVVGIIWTGRIPKNPNVQNSSFLDDILKNQGEEIWTELSFAVPSQKISEHLTKQLLDGKIGEDSASVIRSLLNN